jgi:hypothetical protein
MNLHSPMFHRNAFAALALVLVPTCLHGDTIGYWTLEALDAAVGKTISIAPNEASPGARDAVGSGTAVYSDEVPDALIYDPVAKATRANAWSLDASAANATLTIGNDAAFNSDFTVESFVLFKTEPANYIAFIRRSEAEDLRWQIDIDHGANAAFGRARSRWDTPGAAGIAGVAEPNLDENNNFVLGSATGTAGQRLYIDTGAKDEFGAEVGPQNTNNPVDYVYNAASANPNEIDVALQGDGVNDAPDRWHHVAMSFVQATGEIRFYFDYQLEQTRTLADTEGDGYTHPSAALEIGKLNGESFGLLMDEIRYSNRLLSPGEFLRAGAPPDDSVVIAHWRMEDSEAADGAAVTGVSNASDPLLHGATVMAGTPLYSQDVPGSIVLDPLSGMQLPNRFSLDASDLNARVGAASDAAFDTTFTVEMFVKLLGEPGGYHTFLRRFQVGDLRWQIDFDHGNAATFGRARSRWDTPGSEGTNGINEATDENNNFVVAGQGGLAGSKLWIDTDTGSNNPADYMGADFFTNGDGINDDLTTWHHIALSFDMATGQVRFYFDYVLEQSRTLGDSLMDGYTHPVGPLEFGKFAGAAYGLLIDEVRYSGELLVPDLFLKAVARPLPPFAILSIAYDPGIGIPEIEFRSQPTRLYAVDRSYDLVTWEELSDSVYANAETTLYEDTSLPAAAPRAHYRIRELPPQP